MNRCGSVRRLRDGPSAAHNIAAMSCRAGSSTGTYSAICARSAPTIAQAVTPGSLGRSTRASLALRDQILQTGTGSRRSGVKTGASDSAWLRDVLEKAGGTFAPVVLVTNDRKDVQAFCGTNIQLPVMCNVAALNETLFRFVADPGHLTAHCQRPRPPADGGLRLHHRRHYRQAQCR